MNEQTVELIKALIDKTKSNVISWEPLNTVLDIKPPEDNIFSENIAPMPVFTYIEQGSYFTEQPGGKVFLAVEYNSLLVVKTVHLIVQTDSSKYSTSLATTKDNSVAISSSLKRLYNLVASDQTELNSFINRIIKG